MDLPTAFRRIRLALRFIVPLVLVLALLALALVPLVDALTLRWWVNDLEIRSRLVANTMQEQLVDFVRDGNGARVRQLFRRAMEDERLYALAYCNVDGQIVYRTPTYPLDLGCSEIKGTGPDAHVLRQFPPAPLHVTWFPIPSNAGSPGAKPRAKCFMRPNPFSGTTLIAVPGHRSKSSGTPSASSSPSHASPMPS